MRTIVLAVLGVVILASVASAANTMFDPPLDRKTTVLSAATGDEPKKSITCTYYPRFTVKEIDEGEVGATQLSIVPAKGQKPPCQRKNVAGESVVSPDDWSGYFKGVKGNYVFFDAEDGVNGALGFAVFTADDAKKVFEDSALGDLEILKPDKAGLVLRYKRSYAGRCSVPHDGDACWTKLAAATGLDARVKPDCAAGYLKSKTEMATERCKAKGDTSSACVPAALKELDAQRWDDAPSVIVYEAETNLQSAASTTKPLGAALVCHPSD